jgi:ketosteroid isomerase-like protein
MGRIVDTVKALYEDRGQGDAQRAPGAADHAVEWSEADGFLYADGSLHVGPRAVAEGVFSQLATDVDGFAVVPERFIEGGDAVVVEGRYRGTLRATGRPVDARFAHVWRLRHGKVVRFRQYADTPRWAEAVRG